MSHRIWCIGLRWQLDNTTTERSLEYQYHLINRILLSTNRTLALGVTREAYSDTPSGQWDTIIVGSSSWPDARKWLIVDRWSTKLTWPSVELTTPLCSGHGPCHRLVALTDLRIGLDHPHPRVICPGVMGSPLDAASGSQRCAEVRRFRTIIIITSKWCSTITKMLYRFTVYSGEPSLLSPSSILLRDGRTCDFVHWYRAYVYFSSLPPYIFSRRITCQICLQITKPPVVYRLM